MPPLVPAGSRPARLRAAGARGQQHHSPENGEGAQYRWHRQRLFLVGARLDRPDVQDFLLAREGEASEREPDDADDDEQDADDHRRPHTTRLPWISCSSAMTIATTSS